MPEALPSCHAFFAKLLTATTTAGEASGRSIPYYQRVHWQATVG
jgi:hypothetical protein